MSPPNSTVLRQLHRFDTSSPTFHDQLSNVLSGEEYERSVRNIEDNDLVLLVDYLDKVRRRIAFPYSPFKPVQALDMLDPASSCFQECLRELRNICGTRMILPSSCTVSSSFLNTGLHPVTSWGPGDLYEGTFDGSKVCVKRVQVYSKDGPEKATKVRCPIIFSVYYC